MKPSDSSSVPFLRVAGVPVLLGAVVLALVSDFLLWSAAPGLSWGLFLVVLAVALAARHWKERQERWSRRKGVLLVLLLATAVQSAVEISFTNVVCSLALLVALVGEFSYPGLRAGWERASEALWALVRAPGRWFWAGGVVTRFAAANRGATGTLVRGLQIGLPALLLAAIFASLLGQGNAIFGKWTSAAFTAFWNQLALLDPTMGHLIIFGLLATLSLWVVQPATPGDRPRLWTRPIPEPVLFMKLVAKLFRRMEMQGSCSRALMNHTGKLPVVNFSIAWWRSVLILGVLNLLFFFVNTIDLFHLWTHRSLPAGVTHSQYVREGIASLIVVALLSALVLTALFQQGGGIARDRSLKRLAALWIFQNGLLIAGVLHRLIRYIDNYRLTTQRVYAIAFVLLVATGFVILAVYIARRRTLNWLILFNGLATLTLFFIMQFLNIAGWVAHYNVTRWERTSTPLDTAYLTQLGAPAWPALERAAAYPGKQGANARKALQTARKEERRTHRNWRSWQARRAVNAARVLNGAE